MNKTLVIYLVFGIVIIFALIFDLGILSKKNKSVSIKAALRLTFFWIALALSFFVFVWFEKGNVIALQYLSAYLMEWSLSIDNIFVFILIFSSFGVKDIYFGRALLIGILMAIVFRIIFITIGVALVTKFHWILYLFGAFLIYTGVKMFSAKEEDEFDPHKSKIYLYLKKLLPVVPHDGNGRYIIREDGKRKYTTLFVVVIVLAGIDLVFAMDSIPAVMGVSRDKLVIYTSNIFAVLGLRSLFFLLRGAVDKFQHMQQGIAIVLVFVGIKMLLEEWLNKRLGNNVQVLMSLGVIVLCLSGSIMYSIYVNKKAAKKPGDEENIPG